MVQHTMRKNRLLTVMMTAALAATAFAGCGSNEVATGAKPAVTESKTSETKETEAAETEQASNPDDNTYYHLMSDPNFDMDNAIKDEKKTEELQSSHIDGEVLYNIMDGDRYMEITGTTVTEVNKTFAPNEEFDNRLRFLKNNDERKRRIANAPETPVQKEFPVNMLSKSLHPDRQFVKISDIKVWDENCKSFTFVPDPARGTEKLAFFKAGAYLSVSLDVITIKKCLWHTACVENDCADLCRLFCDVDDVTYGGLKKIGFSRTKTLGYGGDCCDFHFFKK